MKKFEKSTKLDGVSYDVRGPVLEEAERMQEEGISIKIKYRQSGNVWF